MTSAWRPQRQSSGPSISFYRLRGPPWSSRSNPKAPSAGTPPGAASYGYSVSIPPGQTPSTPTNTFTALLIFPETKELTLEELDAVFSVPTRKQVARGLREPWYWVNRYLLGRKVELPPLVDVGQLRGERKSEGMVGGV